MKVNLKYNMGTYSGTIDDMTYCSYKDGKVCIGRRWVRPRETVQVENLANAATNLALIYREADQAYRDDLKAYAAAYATEKTPRDKIAPSSYALFIKMMYAWQASDPEHVFLDSASIADIESMEAPVQSIAEAVEFGLLPRTSNADTLTSVI